MEQSLPFPDLESDKVMVVKEQEGHNQNEQTLTSHHSGSFHTNKVS